MTTEQLPLSGLIVLERSIGIAGGFAGRQFADAGAEVRVVRAETPEWWSESVSEDLRGYLDAGKTVVTGNDDSTFAALAGAADIVIWESSSPPEPSAIEAIAQDRVVALITPRGLHGPRKDDPWTEFTLQAESGSLHMRGAVDREPIQSGSREALWLAGAAAAAGALGALTRGAATVIDVAVVVQSHTGPNNFTDVAASLAGESHGPKVMRRKLSPSIEPASDGWVGFHLASGQNLEDFMVLIDKPEWLADPELRTSAGRQSRVDEWNTAVHAWTRTQTVGEAVAAATAYRIPTAPVHDGRTIREEPQVVARQFFRPAPDGVGQHPAAPFLFDGERAGADRAAPLISELAALDTAPRSARFEESLVGVRVADFGTWWAGALASCVIGALGADVVKIESTRRVDGARTALGVLRPVRPERWWELAQHFLSVNHNKRSVTLDMKTAPGRALVEEIIRSSDILIENFAPRVLESVGLDWAAVRELNPDIVMVRMPAYGLDGPRRDQVGYAQTVEQYAGLCARTGYADATPLNPSGIADPFAALNAAFATLAGLRLARTLGRGLLVETPLAEGAITLASEQAIVHSRTGQLLGRDGNHSDTAAPQGAYPVAGWEEWIAFSIVTDDHWKSLVELAPATAWSTDVANATREGRYENRYSLDEEIGRWTRTWSAPDLLAALKSRGIPSALVQDARFVHEDPQMEATGFYEWVEHPAAGRLALPTIPFRYRGLDRWCRTPSPTLGQHTSEVLREVCDLSDEDIEKLVADGISGTTPANL